MIDQNGNPAPQRILLASDLCLRCDRPLDRAKQLAREWQAGVTVLMVREGPRSPEEVASWLEESKDVLPFEHAARCEVAAEFAGTGVPATLQVVRGDVADSILQAAEALPDALVVVGASRQETFQELILGSCAARLAQELTQPLLVVRQRTRAGYARILVANDFGEAAGRALEAALRLFPDRRIALMHVLEDSAPEPANTRAGALHEAIEDSERFLERLGLPPGARERIDLAIGHGAVTTAILHHVQNAGTELVVLGVHPQSTLARVFIGSISDELLRRLPCDTLLVRAAPGSAHA